jgi:hypothetical protein
MQYKIKSTCWSFDPTHKADCPDSTYTIQDENGNNVSVMYPTKKEAEKALAVMKK